MLLGSVWTRHDAHQIQPGHIDLVLSTVRATGSQLVDDLHRAERSTDHWSNQRLAAALVGGALSNCLSRLAETRLWGEANRVPSGELWRVAGSLLEAGMLQHRARFKPRGYAGDFEMLARICQHYRCDHPLGRAFDEFFQGQAAPQAVRARTEQTAAALVAECLAHDGPRYHAVSVGSGPGLDVREALAMLPEGRRSVVRVTLLDLDPDALDFARRQLEPFLPDGALACIRTNLFRLPQAPDAAVAPEAADLLVCSGLFDYLEDGPAASMLEWFWQRLAPGGLLLVGNFAPHNPSRAYMEWIGNWYLTYRTAQQLEQLAARAGIPADQVTIGCERLGVDLFLVGKKPVRSGRKTTSASPGHVAGVNIEYRTGNVEVRRAQ